MSRLGGWVWSVLLRSDTPTDGTLSGAYSARESLLSRSGEESAPVGGRRSTPAPMSATRIVSWFAVSRSAVCDSESPALYNRAASLTCPRPTAAAGQRRCSLSRGRRWWTWQLHTPPRGPSTSRPPRTARAARLPRRGPHRSVASTSGAWRRLRRGFEHPQVRAESGTAPPYRPLLANLWNGGQLGRVEGEDCVPIRTPWPFPLARSASSCPPTTPAPQASAKSRRQFPGSMNVAYAS